jgi:phosphatidate phosphatase APP1
MSSPDRGLGRIGSALVTVAYRTETGLRDELARRAARRGWTPAVIPYSGYASGDHARVLGRVVLAPAKVDPSARRGVAGWRRLLTLESPGTEVQIEFGGTTTTARSDSAGIVDAELQLDGPVQPDVDHATLRLPGRSQISAHVHHISAEEVRGVICDIDDTVWITGISHPVKAVWRTLRGTSSTRRSVPGMARLLRAAVDGHVHPGVVYLSNGPWNFVGPVTRFLKKHGFPPGAILMTDWGVRPHQWFRDGSEHKSSSLARLMKDLPNVRWVLVGDDGEHDPALYDEVLEAHPDRVAAIALRQVRPGETSGSDQSSGSGAAPILRGADGDELLGPLRDALRAGGRAH